MASSIVAGSGVGADAGSFAGVGLQEHYASAAPILEGLFGGTPLVWVTRPGGLEKPAFYHGPLPPTAAVSVPYVDVATSSGVHRYASLTAAQVERLMSVGAIEFHGWSPRANDPGRAAFARLLVEMHGGDSQDVLREAVLAMRAALFEDGVEGIPVYDGGSGVALWIPFADGPAYPAIRLWLARICARAVARHPGLVTTQPNSHGGPCVHLHVATNAPGRHSILPYSARASAGFPIALPVAWTQFAQCENGSARVGGLDAWIAANGEAFAAELAVIQGQVFGDRGKVVPLHAGVAMPVKSRGHVVAAAITLLGDGVTRDADHICADAIARGLLPAGFERKLVYTALIEYIARANGNGRRPAIVQNGDRSFRINEPVDAWPAVAEPAPVPLSAQRQALIDELDKAAASGDPTAFEVAVCDAFDALGFVATHLGGQEAPDGYADAALGTMGYRVMLECKTGDGAVKHPDTFEAAKYKDAYSAEFCALVGTTFGTEVELARELQTHQVSAWTIEDLQALLRLGASAYEMRPLFAAGFAADRIDDLAWERRHGFAKRVGYTARVLRESVWALQMAQASRNVPEDLPSVSEDAAMLMVDQSLAASGSTAVCDRETVRAAFAYLINTLIGVAVLDPDESALVITKPGV
jgi:DNA primase